MLLITESDERMILHCELERRKLLWTGNDLLAMKTRKICKNTDVLAATLGGMGE